jgi:WD40 repeat protein/tRNA A-37 threonylcarbamoyl transferase component Bud32
MSSQPSDPSRREERLREVLVACIEAAEAGQTVDQEAILARYPEFAAELRDFFAGRAGLERLAEPLRAGAGATGAEPATVGPGESASAGPAVGTRVRYFGDYELIEEIGRGGMGVVYKARQVSLNRIVALKMILAGELANDDDVRRFHAEAEAAAKLDHPGIVPVFEVGQHEGQHYFSMAYVEGESLFRRLAQGLPPPREAAEVILKVAEAVAYAHGAGVIHRDLKPANILIDKHDQPRLTDFGLAKRIHGEPGASAIHGEPGASAPGGLTATGQVLGTPSYMPPEQASGQRGAVGPLADVYSLGAVLYCMLTGRPPFQAANTFDTLMQVLEREPVAPRQLNAAVPRDLETICLKCLQKEPHKRYPSAQDLVADLDRFLNGRPIVAHPVGAWERTVKWARRRPAAAALLLVSGLAVLGLTVGGIVFIVTLDEARRRAEKGETDARTQYELTQDALQQRGEALGRAQKGEADARAAFHHAEGLRLIAQSEVVRADNPGLALVLAVEGAGRAPGLLANNAMQAALDECRELRVLKGHEGAVFSAAFSADGRQVLTCSADGTARLWEAATGKQRLVLREEGVSFVHAQLSPDGRRAITLSWPNTTKGAFSALSTDAASWKNGAPAVQLWDAASGKRIARWQPPPPPVKYCPFVMAFAAAFSADSRLVATSFGLHANGAAVVHDAETGRQAAVLNGHSAPVLAAAFSPDKRTVATTSSDQTACLWEAATGKLLHTLRGHRCAVGTALFSPDGKRLLTLGTGMTHRFQDGQASPGPSDEDAAGRLWDTATGKEVVTLKHAGAAVRPFHAAAFWPNGTAIVLGAASGLGLWDAATGAPKSLSFPYSPAATHEATVAVSPIGMILSAGGDRTPRLYALDREVAVLRGHDDTVHTAAVSPDGRRVVTASADGTARLWDAAVVGFDHNPGHDRWFTNSAALSPDGRRLFVSQNIPPADMLIDASTSQVLAQFDFYAPQAVFTSDGQQVLLVSGRHGVPDEIRDALLLDAATGKVLGKIDNLSARFVSLSADGRLVLMASEDTLGEEDGTASIWETRTGKARAKLKGHKLGVVAAIFSPDGRRVVTHGWERTGRAGRVWDTATGKELVRLQSEQQVLWAAFISGGGQVLAFVQSRPIVARVIDAGTGQERLALSTPPDPPGTHRFAYTFRFAVLSPDGRHVLSNPINDVVGLWDLGKGGEPLVVLQGHTGAVSFARFSPDGRRILTGSEDRTARLWNADTGEALAVCKGHEAAVTGAALDTSTERLVTGSADGTVRLWDARTGQELAMLRWQESKVEEVAFSADRRRVFIHGGGATRLWPVDILSAARARLPRTLTTDECERYEIRSLTAREK